MSDFDSTSSFAAHHGFHCEADVCYRTLDFLGFPGYRVGDDGSVWSRWLQVGLGGRKGTRQVLGLVWRLLRFYCNPNNSRQTVNLYKNRTKKTFLVYHLVLFAFVGPKPAGKEACHNPDPNLSNNCVENLRWGTHKENEQDKIAHGTAQRGEKASNARLTEKDIICIRRLFDGKLMPRKDIAAAYGINLSHVYEIGYRKSWRFLNG